MKTLTQLSPSLIRVFKPVSLNPMPAWKRAFDIGFSLVGIALASPVMIVVAVMTKITSPGPVFFKQTRVGLRGKTFLCYKFRTMKTGADTTGHQAYLRTLIGSNSPMVKMDTQGDARLIPGGWFLRALGLDELPQLFNIFLGDMSLVGPRPCIPYEYDNYLPWQKERFASLPGLTGLWQVSGKNRTTFDEMIRLDIRYSRTKSFWLDLKIVLMTTPAIVQQFLDTRKGRSTTVRPVRASQIQSVAASRRYAAETVLS